MTLQKDSAANCFDSGTIQHELVHVLGERCNQTSRRNDKIFLAHQLGFKHEQSRPDRDNYVQINYENIDQQWVRMRAIPIKCNGNDAIVDEEGFIDLLVLKRFTFYISVLAIRLRQISLGFHCSRFEN